MQSVLVKPFQRFLQIETAGSALLLLATVGALSWANMGWGTGYDAFWHTALRLGFADFQISQPLQFWINEGLMTLFFLLVGLEIKRELVAGELSSPQQARLPILGALGGMVVPAGLYVLLNPPGSAYAWGWGIPTVTDIAFAVGALTLLGKRVPIGLKVFLTALAIVDDIGAILIIALFYSQGIHLGFLAWAAGIVLLAALVNRLGGNRLWPYLVLGFPLWLALLNSGIHPTIAGVLLAFTIPASAKWGAGQTGQAPLQRLEHTLQPWVTYGVLPLFALANAGVHIPWQGLSHVLQQPLPLGIIAGLFLGKPLGITLAAWVAVRAGWAKLPTQVSWPQIHAAGVLGGIGFTMSVFITLLAFREPSQTALAKLAILLASGLSALVGVGLLWLSLQKSHKSALPSPQTEEG
jgi:NhaA family Na+:H+ antiporter